MNNYDNIDLTRGYQKYDAMVKNIEGILNKINYIFDITEYKNELDKIVFDASNDPGFSNKMPFEGLQLDYESFIFDKYINRLNNLQEKIEKDLMPLYEIYLLTSKINIQIKNVTSDNINDVINITLKLLDAINNLRNNLNDKEKELVNKAYEAIYNVLLYEEIFERNDIFNYIMKLNNVMNKENIGRLLAKDINKLSQEDIIDEDLKGINTEGLGYDYLTLDVVKKVSLKTVGETNSEYQERKRSAILAIKNKSNSLNSKRNSLDEELSRNKKLIKNLKINKALLISKACSIVLVPVLTISAGGLIGKSKSDKITEYKTITRTVNIDTGDLIGDISYEYDDKETTYAATILICEPWRKNSVGEGYVRNVTAYDYANSNNIPYSNSGSNESNNTKKDNIDNLKFKYQYIEAASSLNENDSIAEGCTIVIETYQDKSDSRTSTKYIIPFTIAGGCIGLLLDVLSILLGIYSFYDIKNLMDNLNKQIISTKLNNEQIIKKLNKIKDDALLLQSDYNDTAKKYGIPKEEFIIPKYRVLVKAKNKH